MRIVCRLALIAMLLPLSAGASAQALVADLSDHLIAVTTGFSGAELLLSGATDGDGDVVVVVRGPDQDVVVRRKEKVAGIWVNRSQMTFSGVPTFYNVASSRPVAELAPTPLLIRTQIGSDHLHLRGPEDANAAELAAYREALIRNKQNLALFPAQDGKVIFLGNRLFRTDVSFPSNVPTGAYTVTVYLLRDGEVVSAQATPLIVSKTGFGARLFDFAHQQAAIYGIFAVLIALFVGWAAGTVFRKV